jgi:DNA-binding GntR family transcriptional regulator
MIKAGDSDRAAAEMDAHLSRARKKLVAHLKQQQAAAAA